MELVISRQTDEQGDGLLTLVGSIDLVTRQGLLDAGMEVLRGGGTLTLDMAGVDFIDSTGIGALVQLTKAAESHGQELVLSQRSDRVNRVLEATGLDGVWRQV